MANKKEFESVALVHLEAVCRAAYALCGGREAAEDLVQMTYLKAFEGFGSFKKGTNCKAWLTRILRNSWIDRLRHNGVVGNVVSIEEGEIAAASEDDDAVWSECEDVLERFSDEQVIKALRELPEEQRLTLFLIDVEGVSQEEAAEIMEVAVGTVKSRTSRARAVLKERLVSYAKDMGFMRDKI